MCFPVNDTIDNVMDDSEDEEEQENFMNKVVEILSLVFHGCRLTHCSSSFVFFEQIFDEIGIEIGGKLASTPRGELPQVPVEEEFSEDMHLEERLAKLKGI